MRARHRASSSTSRRQVLATRAHELRWSRATPSEERLWSELRAKKLGVSFRRQVSIAGRYIADFVAQELRLIVEVDGACHAERGLADARRDERLTRLGYRVLRLSAELVTYEPAVAVERIRAELRMLGR